MKTTYVYRDGKVVDKSIIELGTDWQSWVYDPDRFEEVKAAAKEKLMVMAGAREDAEGAKHMGVHEKTKWCTSSCIHELPPALKY